MWTFVVCICIYVELCQQDNRVKHSISFKVFIYTKKGTDFTKSQTARVHTFVLYVVLDQSSHGLHDRTTVVVTQCHPHDYRTYTMKIYKAYTKNKYLLVPKWVMLLR